METQFKPDPQKLYATLIAVHANRQNYEDQDLWIEQFSKLVEAMCGVKPAPPKEPKMPEPDIGQVWEFPSNDKWIIINNAEGLFSYMRPNAPFHCIGKKTLFELKNILVENHAACLGMANIILPDDNANTSPIPGRNP